MGFRPGPGVFTHCHRSESSPHPSRSQNTYHDHSTVMNVARIDIFHSAATLQMHLYKRAHAIRSAILNMLVEYSSCPIFARKWFVTASLRCCSPSLRPSSHWPAEQARIEYSNILQYPVLHVFHQVLAISGLHLE